MAVLYADGGIIQDSYVRSRSKIGGSYAYVVAKGETKITEGSGVLTPADVGTKFVTNNQVELLSVIRGVQWARENNVKLSVVYSDSKVTLGRVFQGWNLKNIPDWMANELFDLDDYLDHVRGQFVKGHNGNKWNEYVDQLAASSGAKYMRNPRVDRRKSPNFVLR